MGGGGYREITTGFKPREPRKHGITFTWVKFLILKRFGSNKESDISKKTGGKGELGSLEGCCRN